MSFLTATAILFAAINPMDSLGTEEEELLNQQIESQELGLDDPLSILGEEELELVELED